MSIFCDHVLSDLVYAANKSNNKRHQKSRQRDDKVPSFGCRGDRHCRHGGGDVEFPGLYKTGGDVSTVGYRHQGCDVGGIRAHRGCSSGSCGCGST